MNRTRKRLCLLLILLAVSLGLAAGLQWLYPEAPLLFRFKVPANSRVSLLWERNDIDEAKRIELKANPGDQLRVFIEPGDAAIPALDELPKDFFMEVPAQPGAEPPPIDSQLLSQIKLVEFDNRPLERSRFQFFWESFEHPLLAELRRREKLDELLAGCSSEFEQFVRLLHWTHKQWEVGKPDPYPPWNALEILDWVRSGKTKGFCAQYAQVMVQCLLSLGYQARYVSLANHEVIEAWSNQYCKWVTFDPNDGIYYTDGRTPLSCYEIYLALMEGRTEGIKTEGGLANPERFKSYGVFFVSTRNDHLSQGRSASEYLKDMWKERVFMVTPYTGSLPYEEGKLRPVTQIVSDLYFPLNTACVRALRPGGPDEVEIWLDTVTPGFAGFLASQDGGDFESIQPRHNWKLHAGRNEITLVSSNRPGIRGPDTRIAVDKLSD